MRETRILMGMPITIDIGGSADDLVERVFDYFDDVDRRFSTYRTDSEISAINRGDIPVRDWSGQMLDVMKIAEQTRRQTDGYFDIHRPDGALDPSGIVKGWAIRNAAEIVRQAGVSDFFIEAGGDIQSCGRNASGRDWSVGIRNPFHTDEIIKVIYPRGRGVATSGTYARGQHIYNPRAGRDPITDIVSVTVIGLDVLEADRFATAAFAMGRNGILFLEQAEGLEGYLVDSNRRATPTSGFGAFCQP
ncbi:FAD:protein FMN transferase [Mesorhizobium sp. M1E.F.Ca.ET.045.02.1.1]|nr:FAD:protein FMN transferase [Mesorhizobium sp. M1E.F.Ca.ET.045.02.1.1]RUW33729.1 FAD:protein FMN transferase [Mesorhizobium sp. M1E.F.Ca.ET.041.01.1.1]RUW83593.1 FAD:protein FMN transferase [Mesorhizobium sp. M1E.F.Ca.ET.063.01.1.1]RWD90359.1 MAG: FAD:protein FMN transferase [Mesorhizobium sp.]RWD95536.1 MAG: FAD:protein FMN transferase [Mesorhizobium sp.]